MIEAGLRFFSMGLRSQERIVAAVDVYDDVLQMRDIDIAKLARQDGLNGI